MTPNSSIRAREADLPNNPDTELIGLCEQLAHRHGHTDASVEAAKRGASSAVWAVATEMHRNNMELLRQIASMQARTLEGLEAKAQAAMFGTEKDEVPLQFEVQEHGGSRLRVVQSIVADLLALGGDHA